MYELLGGDCGQSLYAHFEDGNWAEIQRQLKALELAIDKVETDCTRQSLRLPPEPPLTYRDLTNRPVAEWSIQKQYHRPVAYPTFSANYGF